MERRRVRTVEATKLPREWVNDMAARFVKDSQSQAAWRRVDKRMREAVDGGVGGSKIAARRAIMAAFVSESDDVVPMPDAYIDAALQERGYAFFSQDGNNTLYCVLRSTLNARTYDVMIECVSEPTFTSRTVILQDGTSTYLDGQDCRYIKRSEVYRIFYELNSMYDFLQQCTASSRDLLASTQDTNMFEVIDGYRLGDRVCRGPYGSFWVDNMSDYEILQDAPMLGYLIDPANLRKIRVTQGPSNDSIPLFIRRNDVLKASLHTLGKLISQAQTQNLPGPRQTRSGLARW